MSVTLKNPEAVRALITVLQDALDQTEEPTAGPEPAALAEPQYLGAVVTSGDMLWVLADPGGDLAWRSNEAAMGSWKDWDGLLARGVRYLTASERADRGMPALTDGMSIEVPDSIEDVRATLRVAQVALEDTPDYVPDWEKRLARLRALIVECDRIVGAEESR